MIGGGDYISICNHLRLAHSMKCVFVSTYRRFLMVSAYPNLREIERWMDGWMDEWMDGWIDR